MSRTPVLPDYLAPGLDVIFCGMAAGPRSARIGHYYAGRGNRFWAVLQATGLTPIRLQPEEDARVLEFGIGLTDVAKFAAGCDHAVPKVARDGASALALAAQYHPRALDFNGKAAASAALGRAAALLVDRALARPRVGFARLASAPKAQAALWPIERGGPARWACTLRV